MTTKQYFNIMTVNSYSFQIVLAYIELLPKKSISLLNENKTKKN